MIPEKERKNYNRETIEYVRQICKKDIEYFNFKFDEKDNYGAR